MELLWHEIPARILDWRAPLEILLIALGLYFLYRNLSAMGAWKIVMGILIGLGVYAVARLLGLTGIEWVLSHFSGVALIALIVLFQPEIRRLFERAVSFRRAGHRAERPGLTALLTDALFDLARRKWGAIVVIPGRESLTTWTSRGIALDATPSFPLLISIFDPTSPGHDGAAVVENEKLTAFGVRLPLSARGKLPAHHGTRHHAALGLSEVTDALVLVVSEERQTISAFVTGQRRRIGSKEQLAKVIDDQWERTLGGTAPGRAASQRRIASVPLLGSLLVATLFWLSIVPHRGEQVEVTFQVPVEYAAAPDLTLVGERVDQARILVAGAADDLSRVDPSLLRVRVDLSTVEAGQQLVPLILGGVELPRGVRLVDIEPPSLALDLRPLVEMRMPIRAQLVGVPRSGFRVDQVEVQPRSLRVMVPEGGPDIPEEILTEPIRLTGVSGPTRVISRLVAPSGIRPVGGSWPDVEVRLTVLPVEGR